MKKDFLEMIKKELKTIKNEGKVEDVNIENVDVEERKIHNLKQRKIKKFNLKKGIAFGTAAVALMTAPIMPIKVISTGTAIEAQAITKDNKKPIIKFIGSKKISVIKGKKIKIPKTTAKDNKDGNVTKKIKVAVKKGNKEYASIANKIKSNKSVKFNENGNYVITYTVKDKAGNKATKKRYIYVGKKNSDYNLTTQIPATTQKPTSTTKVPATTQKPTSTTSAPATTQKQNTPINTPTTEAPAPENTRKVQVGAYKYNLSSENFDISQSGLVKNGCTISYSNSYDTLYFSKESGLQNDGKFLQFIGNITAASGGKLLTSQVVIYDYALTSPNAEYDQVQKVYIAVKTSDTRTVYDTIDVVFKRYQPTEEFKDVTDHTVLSHTPAVLGDKKIDIWAESLNMGTKKLVLSK